MKTMTDRIRNLMFGAALVSLLNSCAEEENFMAKPAEPAPVPISGELCFSLKLSLNENTGMTRTTSGSDDETTRPGVENENAIHSVCLFFEDLNSDGNPAGQNPKTWFRVPCPGEAPDGTVTFKINQGGSNQLTTGLKKVYIGANLSSKQADCFADGNKEYAVPVNEQQDNYGSLAEEYAPGRGIGLDGTPDAAYTRNDIAMFCTAGQQLTLTEDNDRYSISESFALKRNVAKMLVTCKVAEPRDLVEDAEQDIKYCVLTKGLKGRGWIRQGDVRFLVNGLNRKSYIMQRATWIADQQLYYYEDPNKDLNENISIGQDGTPVPQNLRENFLYHAVQTLNKQSRFYVKTLPYEENRMPNGINDKTCYYEGLYCPENTFDLSLTDDANRVILANYNYPWPMITHVSITAKFTPKDLFVEKEMADYIDLMNVKELPDLTPEMKSTIKDLIAKGSSETTLPEKIVRITSPSENVSWAILTASLNHYKMVQTGQIYDEQQPGFPENTYLSVVGEQGETEFYTYGAARTIAVELGKWTEKDDPKKLASFKAMPRGRGYYYTYVDNRKATDKPADTPPTYADGQVERNVYYILTVDAFATPGRTGSEPEYIKVHTRVEAWKDGGSANVELN